MNKLLEEWQDRLGLQEWRITLVDNCEPDDMTEKAQGYTNWNEVQKTAKIEIIDPQFYGTRVVPFDYEQTLIHELLHLKFTLLQDDENSLQDRITHQLIDDMARALVDVKRSKGNE